MANFSSRKKAKNKQFAHDPEKQVSNSFCCLTMLAFLIFAYKVPAIPCMQNAKVQFLSRGTKLHNLLFTTAVHSSFQPKRKPLPLNLMLIN